MSRKRRKIEKKEKERKSYSMIGVNSMAYRKCETVEHACAIIIIQYSKIENG